MKKYRKRPITHIIHRKEKATKINHNATLKHLIDIGQKKSVLECDYCHKIIKKNLIDIVLSTSLNFQNKLEEVKRINECEKCGCFNHSILDQ